MSYCRWSSDNWKSDVYAWLGTDGVYWTCVAGMRFAGEAPKVDWTAANGDPEGQIALERWLTETERVPIGLSLDSATFGDATLQFFLCTLRMLQGAGYHVPADAIAAVEAEIAALNPPPPKSQ